ncbi:sensor histidine kinase [Rufibacter latericius]|uniref:Sensor histidine kinase n=1 Tax=Rufibacter latericius TaxID=2487040 RepID=A0A3M9MUH5_9BACT|nr:histidine kinase [Rufibacter latericius]RNI29181.1 sensor histidine kinase [Rufibacter latericius]
MNDLVNNPSYLKRVEFWGATTIFVFAVFFLTTISHGPDQHRFEEAGIPFYYYQDYFFPRLIRYTLLYLGFLVLNFKVIPRLLEKEGLVKNILAVLALFLLVGLVFGITDTYSKNYIFNRYASEDEAYQAIFQGSYFYAFRLLLLIGFYSFIKFVGLYLLSSSEVIQSKYRLITRDGLAAFVIWMISMFLLMVVDAEGELILGWGIVGPSSILLYCYSFYALIPKSLPKKKPFRAYVGKAVLVLIASLVPIGFLALLLVQGNVQDNEFAFLIAIFNVFFQLLITVPVSWVLFKRQMQGNAEIHVLKQELGQSTANFDFLRSQINPHFLFNALNTIYGTAIQENAERTSEGVERLGNMMRFMLQENLQERISLVREVEYLENYISFQRLRTDESPSVRITAQIEQPIGPVQISPMLLIPFVENAFKHGISFREPSHINITLEVKEKTLYFDVHNSKHDKQGTDPEKDKSGIGLVNVRQRLQLLYPGRHELIIRETGKEFFVHLTLQVS